MRVLAIDSDHGYFLLGCTLEEVKKKIIPQQEDLLDRYSGDGHKTYYVSSVETREKELAAQAIIKANPYIGRTREYGILIKEVPHFDAYVMIRYDLSELYFVPFDYFYPDNWRGDFGWGSTIKKDIKSLIEVTKLPFVNANGEPYSEWIWTNGDAEALLADYQEEIYSKWKKRGPKFCYRILMAEFRKYHISHLEFESLLGMAGVIMPPYWYEMDSAHRHICNDILDDPEPEDTSVRTTEQEKAIIAEMVEQGFTDSGIHRRFYNDYLDGRFTWETFMECVPQEDVSRYDDLQGLLEEERKKRLWLGTTNAEEWDAK